MVTARLELLAVVGVPLDGSQPLRQLGKSRRPVADARVMLHPLHAVLKSGVKLVDELLRTLAGTTAEGIAVDGVDAHLDHLIDHVATWAASDQSHDWEVGLAIEGQGPIAVPDNRWVVLGDCVRGCRHRSDDEAREHQCHEARGDTDPLHGNHLPFLNYV